MADNHQVREAQLVKELKLLTSVIEFSQEQLSFSEMLSFYLESVSSLFNASFSLIYLREREHNNLFPSEIRYSSATPFPKIIEQYLDKGNIMGPDTVPGKVLKTDQPYLWRRQQDDSSPLRETLANTLSLDGSVSIPISRFGKVIAVAEFAITNWQDFSQESIERACSAAIQIGVALERLKSQKQIEQNFSELASAHRKLKETQKQLIQAEKMASLGLLSAGVAHEINNPVGFVKSNLETLGEYVDVFIKIFTQQEVLLSSSTIKDEEEYNVLLQNLKEIKKENQYEFIQQDISDLLKDSQSGLRRIINIVSDLKVFAHTGDEEKRLQNVNASIENAINIIWNEIKHEVDLVKDLNPLPNILCNLGELSQVFMNLLINARHAIDGHGTISVTSYKLNDKILIKVADSGKGIDKDSIDRIFDPFYTTKPAGIGTGLGLSISYGIVQSYGGQIEVKSEVGTGTEFTIILPVNQ